MHGLAPNHIFVESKTGRINVILIDYIIPFPNWILVIATRLLLFL